MHDGRPSYTINAGTRYVGTIYQTQWARQQLVWLWSVSGVVNGMREVPMGGSAETLDIAREAFRACFDDWLAWALEQGPDNLSFSTIDKHLREMGARV